MKRKNTALYTGLPKSPGVEYGDYVTLRQPIATFVTEDLAATMPGFASRVVPLVTDGVRFSYGAVLAFYRSCSFSLDNVSIYSYPQVANKSAMCYCSAAGSIYVSGAIITWPY